jgi:hypothetical protein
MVEMAVDVAVEGAEIGAGDQNGLEPDLRLDLFQV